MGYRYKKIYFTPKNGPIPIKSWLVITYRKEIQRPPHSGGPITNSIGQTAQPSTTSVIASRKAAHPRVASLAPAGQFTFWQSPGSTFRFAHCTRRFPRGFAPRNDIRGRFCAPSSEIECHCEPVRAHPRVASLAPAGQFTFWQSPGSTFRFAHYTRRFPQASSSE